MKKVIAKIGFLSAICIASLAFSASVLAATQNVSIVDYSFSPSNLQINAGDTVVWTNNGQMAHTVTSDSNGSELNSGTLNHGISYSHTFNSTGSFPYHCAFHSSLMTGAITVSSGSGNTGNAAMSVTKQVINLTSGNLNWQNSVSANPGDVLSFAITMQASGQDIHNVFVRDILPSNLIYKNNLTVNANLNYAGDPMSGINIGTIPANGVAIVAYQVQVAPTNYSYANATVNNLATVTSAEIGSQTASATVLINNLAVAPINYNSPTYISTGLTNNPVRDSFFLPIMLIILGSWLYFSGRIYIFSDWLGSKIN